MDSHISALGIGHADATYGTCTTDSNNTTIGQGEQLQQGEEPVSAVQQQQPQSAGDRYLPLVGKSAGRLTGCKAA